MGIAKRIGRPGRAAFLIAVAAAGVGAALAVASVPDSTGVIHACIKLDPASGFPASGPNLHIQDPANTNDPCTNSPGGGTTVQSITWNQTGPAGANGTNGTNGTNGAPGTVTAGNRLLLPDGTTLTIAGNSSPAIAPVPTGNQIGTITLNNGGAPISTNIVGFNVENTSKAGSGTGGAGSGKAKFNEFSIRKTMDKASAAFFKNCVAGAHYKSVTLALRKAGGSSAPYLVYKFETVFTTAVQWSGPGDEGPEETVTFVYGALTVNYQTQGSGKQKKK